MRPSQTGLSENQLIRVEVAIASRAAVAAIAHVAVFIAFRQLSPFPHGVPRAVDLGGIGIISTFFARWALVLLQRTYYPDALWRKRWQILFRTVSLILAGSWSVVSVATLIACGVTVPFMIVVVILLGIASIAVQAFGLDLLFTQIFILLILMPTIAALIASREPGHTGLAFVLAIAIGYLLFLSNSAFRFLLGAMRNRDLIQAQRDQLTAVFDAIPGYVFWTDGTGNTLGLNRRLSEAYHTSAQTLLGRKAIGLEPNDPLSLKLDGFLAGENSELLVEVPFSLPEGSRNSLVAMRKYQSATGVQAVVIAIDTEDRKRAQEELESARAQAYESARLAALGAMAAGIAHEINNPLQVIRALAELLRKKTIDPAKAAAKIDEIIDRVAKIIASLRTFARVDQGLPLEIVELQELIGEVVDLARVSQPQNRVPIEVRPIPKDLAIECRRIEIGQVLINLLNNAIDAVAGSPEPWIRIEVEARPSEIALRIEDSGPGVPDELAEKIMLPFFTTKPVGKGTGLGLSISKSIAERHRGTLRLDRHAGHTTFVLTLPRGASHV